MARGRRDPVTIEGFGNLKQLQKALRAYGGPKAKELRRRLAKELRGVLKPAVPAVRGAVRRIPSKGQNKRRGRRSLRSDIARATTLKMRAQGKFVGAEISIRPDKMPDDRRNLASYMEGESPFNRWRHPIFGDRNRWVQLQPRHQFFYKAVEPHLSTMREAADRIVVDVAADLEKEIKTR
ncbi:hypothetical protein [Nocardiopsis synnemataformans]|uniref:hypothetical protein n=1 Tax=Nocardiopsis synnemataformans TaxID=61305 RepID=UPI003EB93155